MASRHYAEFEILDYSESRSSFSFSVGAITAVSLPGFLTNLGALRTALGNIVKGTISRERWVGDETVLSNIPPSDPDAQRELAWRVQYIGDFDGYYDFTIACPDTSLLRAGTDFADKSSPAMAAFITAIEAIARTPLDDEEQIIVTDIYLVGRKYKQ
jgi:hypothetical protein